jgi:hypothetical protein
LLLDEEQQWTLQQGGLGNVILVVAVAGCTKNFTKHACLWLVVLNHPCTRMHLAKQQMMKYERIASGCCIGFIVNYDHVLFVLVSTAYY